MLINVFSPSYYNYYSILSVSPKSGWSFDFTLVANLLFFYEDEDEISMF